MNQPRGSKIISTLTFSNLKTKKKNSLCFSSSDLHILVRSIDTKHLNEKENICHILIYNGCAIENK